MFMCTVKINYMNHLGIFGPPNFCHFNWDRCRIPCNPIQEYLEQL